MKKILYSIVQRFIPYHFLRNLKKKINIHYFLFGPASKTVGSYLINEKDTSYSSYNEELHLGDTVSKGFADCIKEYESHNGLVRKYVLSVNDCIIEPEYGWGITSKGKLIFDSISNNSWRETYHPNYFTYKTQKSNAILVEEAISINMIKGGEDNYWHFLHDLLGEVTLALKYIGSDIPFIVSKNLWEKSYFKQALTLSSTLSGLTWLVRDEQFYQVKKVWFIQVLPSSNEQFFGLQQLLEIPLAPINGNRKVFLTRSKKRIRNLSNSEAIESIAAKHGFEIIDADYFSLQQQIQLFSETRWLIGIHGAGLTNILFKRDAPLHLLELLPADYLQPHYFWLAKGLGHQYTAVVGSTLDVHTSFSIDEQLFEQKIKELLEQQ